MTHLSLEDLDPLDFYLKDVPPEIVTLIKLGRHVALKSLANFASEFRSIADDFDRIEQKLRLLKYGDNDARRRLTIMEQAHLATVEHLIDEDTKVGKAALNLRDTAKELRNLLNGREGVGAAEPDRTAGPATEPVMPPDQALRDQVIDIVRRECAGWTPAASARHVSDRHGHTIKLAQMRNWMLRAGLWHNTPRHRPNETSAEPWQRALADSPEEA